MDSGFPVSYILALEDQFLVSGSNKVSKFSAEVYTGGKIFVIICSVRKCIRIREVFFEGIFLYRETDDLFF